jgi:hypothetical protein
MIESAALVGIAALLALLVFFWQRSGVGSGRMFGNRIAAHIGMPKKVFHMLLAHGARDAYARQLAALEKSHADLDQASVQLGPVLAKGVERMEARFGRQEMVDKVKPIVARLASAFEQAR